MKFNLLCGRTLSANDSNNASRSWGWVAASMALVVALLYGIGWQPAAWHWTPVIALGYVLPIALAALCISRNVSLALSLLAVLSIPPLAWRGRALGLPAGSLAGMGATALFLPAWAYAISSLAYLQHDRQVLAMLNDALNNAGQAIVSSLDIDTTLTLLMDKVQEVLNIESGSLLLREGEQLVFRVSFGPAGEQVKAFTLEMGQGIAGWVAQTGRSILVPDVKKDTRHFPGIDLATDYRTRSILCVPLKGAEERVIGVLEAINPRDRENFTDQDRILLESIAAFAVTAIQNARLHQQTVDMTENLESLVQERTEALAQANRELTTERDRLNALYRIMRELSSSLELERMLNRALILINRALEVEYGVVLIRSSTGRTLAYRAIVGRTSPTADGRAFPAPRLGDTVEYRRDEGILGWLMSHSESLSVEDLSVMPRWRLFAGQEQWHRSVLAAPLLSGEEVRGGILLYHSGPGHFTADHQRMLGAIASQIAITVSSIEMFSLLSESADRLGNMLRLQQLEGAKSQAILEGVADGVMVMDAEGKVTLFNAAAERILQVPRTEVMGRSESDLPGLLGLAGTSWSELTERWGREQGHPDVQEIHEEQCECQGRVISMRVAPVVRQGMFEGTVSVFRDITKDIEVDRMKSEFISMVSHELRTPMTSIKGYIDLLYSGMAGPVTDGQKRFLQTAKVNVDRLTMLVNSLLEISHFDTGKVRLSIEAVNPLQAVKEVVDDMRAAAEEKGQSLVSVIQAPVPNVRADPARLKNVLAQLVDNACKYTPEGGRITINAREVEGYVHFSVQDNGVGISPKDRTKLFSRFFRADDPQIQAYAGTGLGLVIAKSYVELHGGEMWVESELGRGSTFTFSIPLATAETEVKARLAFKTIRYRSQDRHILVIEDEVDVANEIAYQLRGQGGYRVHVATCARDALDYLAQAGHPIDLITLDLRLPDMNGLEFLSQLKKDKRHVDTPVVVVSVLAEQQEGRLDVEAYLSKPIQGDRLLATIGEVLAERTKVLIVEDDKLLAEALRLALENYGFTAVVEHDGLKAVDVVRDERPGLILLDIKLPGMDGHTILRKLKATPDTREIPVIVITGSVSDVETKRQQVMEVGAAQFLTKPIQISDLVAEIQHALADERQA